MNNANNAVEDANHRLFLSEIEQHLFAETSAKGGIDIWNNERILISLNQDGLDLSAIDTFAAKYDLTISFDGREIVLVRAYSWY